MINDFFIRSREPASKQEIISFFFSCEKFFSRSMFCGEFCFALAVVGYRKAAEAGWGNEIKEKQT